MALSHPTRVRGLKFVVVVIGHKVKVAPYTGAWIEIVFKKSVQSDLPSHPTRVRGLKFQNEQGMFFQGLVAPYTGAWIEINDIT